MKVFPRILTLALLAAGLIGAQAPAPKGATPQVPATKSAPAAGQAIDINAASVDELKSIPGIGDAYANKIIAGRPYQNKAQLKSRNILPASVYAKVSPQLIARQPKRK